MTAYGHVEVEVEEVIRETGVGAGDGALLVSVDGEEYWIPKAAIHADSEVWREGQTGTLVIPLRLAEEKGLA